MSDAGRLAELRPRALVARLRSGLTPRGKGFFLAALVALVAGEVLGERDLVRVAALLVALPVISLVVVARSRYRVRLTRSLTPPRVQAGREARVLLRMENVSRLPTGTLLMEDTLPYALGGRPRFVLRGVETGGIREVTYAVRTEFRGRFPIGPLRVRITDPFGCAEMQRSFSSHEMLTVTPVVWRLPALRLGGDWLGGGEGRANQVALSGEPDVSIREYREGDDLRRIHWKATARTGDLMVRRDEQPKQNRAAVLLDTRAAAHRGDGPSSSFEWAVSAAASVAMWLSQRGYAVRLLGSGGVDVAASPTGPTSTGVATALLGTLAVIDTDRATDLATGAGRLRHDGGGLVVAVTGVLDEPDTRLLAAALPTSGTGVAVLLDTPSWATRARPPDPRMAVAERRLTAAGWRVLVVRQGDELAARWPEVAQAPGRTFQGIR